MTTRAARLVLVFASALALLSAATAQVPPPPAQQLPANQQQQAASALGSANRYAPGPLGQPRPNVGPDPMPQIRRATDCPLGYVALRDKARVAHLTVCVVRPPNQTLLNSVGGPGATQPGRMSSMPPILERTEINQCLGRPPGSYACGRGGTECCGPKQDNMCFAGAYACYAYGAGTGPRTACCISK